MQSRTKILPKYAFVVTLGASIFLGACEVEFTPDVEPLILEEAQDQPFADEITSQEGDPDVLVDETTSASEPLSEFTSSDALALCGEGLAWGDDTKGICLAPGGDSYFAWTAEGSVIRILADASDINQTIFQQAVRDRASAIEEVKREARSTIFEGIAFGVSIVAAVPACATILGCAVVITAISVSGGMLADSGSSIVDELDSGDSASKRADYSYCRMTGGSDPQCRTSAGITSELGGN